MRQLNVSGSDNNIELYKRINSRCCAPLCITCFHAIKKTMLDLEAFLLLDTVYPFKRPVKKDKLTFCNTRVNLQEA